MKKMLLVGNGMTSQLISGYKDQNMIAKFKSKNIEIYNELNCMLEPFRKLGNKSEKEIVKLLESMGIEYHHYHRYFINQNLIDELYKSEIIAIETLLKVAHLFHYANEINYNAIKTIANEIYFNEGNNGIEAIDNTRVDIKKYCDLIQEFDAVFTTNFDNVLDEACRKEICHLHGGFYYKRRHVQSSTFIEKVPEMLSPEEAHLIWGHNEDEKKGEMAGGISFPISFPIAFGASVLEKYLQKLSDISCEELHIWGYSGLNDGHINNAIKKNNNIKNIVYYGNPIISDKNEYKEKIISLFCDENNKDRISVRSWNDMWDKVWK